MVVLDGVDLDTLNYIHKFPYNGTIATGGDSLNEDLNIFYEVPGPRDIRNREGDQLTCGLPV